MIRYGIYAEFELKTINGFSPKYHYVMAKADSQYFIL